MRSNTGITTLPLLHVDDNANERLLVKRAIFITHTPFAFHEAGGLESAIPYFEFHLKHPEKFPRPAMVLLDYEMGEHTGADFLCWLRGIKKITSIPVALFSGSVGKRHVESCYANGANYFISKPKDSGRLREIVKALYQSAVSQRAGPVRSLDEYQPNPRLRRAEDCPPYLGQVGRAVLCAPRSEADDHVQHLELFVIGHTTPATRLVRVGHTAKSVTLDDGLRLPSHTRWRWSLRLLWCGVLIH